MCPLVVKDVYFVLLSNLHKTLKVVKNTKTVRLLGEIVFFTDKNVECS